MGNTQFKDPVHGYILVHIMPALSTRWAFFTEVIPKKIRQPDEKKTEFFYLFVPNSFKSQKAQMINKLVEEAQT